MAQGQDYIRWTI